MKLEKFFVVFMMLSGTMCRSKMMININEPDGLVDLEEATIHILATCYANQAKTVALIGEFPGKFVTRLSSHRSISVTLVDPRMRAEKNVDHWNLHHQKLDWNERYINSMHKVHVAVAMAPCSNRLLYLLTTYKFSPFYNSEVTLLIIGWSSADKYVDCDNKLSILHLIFEAVRNEILNAKLLCRNRNNEIVIYDMNPFKHKAPEPWKWIYSTPSVDFYHLFVREYQKNEGICKNLNYEKTHDVGSITIATTDICVLQSCQVLSNEGYGTRLERIEAARRRTFISNFITYVNATRYTIWRHAVKGGVISNNDYSIITRPIHLNGIIGCSTFTYPHGQDCKFLISQFRGNKSQLKKILGTIDNYSWIGMGVVYVITWTFFKYLLHQPLIAGMLNLFRLTCNTGLVTVPERVSSRIYLGCLFFFVVTMQGIMVGNLASLLTHEIPVRQIDTMKDLVDLDYTIYVYRKDLPHFEDPVFNERVIPYVEDEDCIKYIEHDPSAVCVTWGAATKMKAYDSGLHVSPGCFILDYVVNILPWKWHMEPILNKYMKITFAADIMLNLNELVHEKRFFEAESEEVPEEPEIMILSELGFAFVVIGIGLVCSLVCFIIEIVIYRFNRRVTRTRIIVL